MAQLVEAAERDDFAAARELHTRLLPLMQVNFVESNPIPVKAAMAADGPARGELSPADGPAPRGRRARGSRGCSPRPVACPLRPRVSEPSPSCASRLERLFAAAGRGRPRARPAPPSPSCARPSRAARSARPSPIAGSATGWRVNAWVKQGILLGFRTATSSTCRSTRAAAVLRQGHAAAEAARRRCAACASCRAARRSATARIVAPRRRLHAADVRQRRRVRRRRHADRLATRWSARARRSGKRVHLSAAAQIGGVLEPVGALPVIVEDEVLVGGDCGVYEGTVVQAARRARRRHDPHRLDAGLRSGERADPEPSAGRAARDPRGRGRGPGRARGDGRARAAEWGLSLSTPVIVKYRDAQTDAADGARGMATLSLVDLARALIDTAPQRTR